MAATTMASLAKLISESVTKIETNCAQRGVQLPTLDDPFSPESEAPRNDPEILDATAKIVAAAAQLIALVRPAPSSLVTASLQMHVSSALRVALQTNTVEILREAGPQGLHINDIAAKSNTDPGKLGRVLRLLATECIFKEVSPDVFANNRISSVADTGKPASEIIANPKDKHVGTSGLPAILEHTGDEVFKASAYLGEVFSNPDYVHSYAANRAAVNLAFNMDLPVFQWFELPENELRLHRFGIGMEGMTKSSSSDVIVKGFDWQDLPEGSVVVDVGGGIGSQSLAIAKVFPHLKIIVEDRPATIADGDKFWRAALPEALDSGRVVFRGHDFFEEQPIKGAAVYFMRAILHDWSDSYCLDILKRIRAAAAPHSQLLVIDTTMSYACQDTTITRDVPGSQRPVAPEPLLPNFGHAKLTDYLADMQMLVALNGQERTLAHFDKLFTASGWKLQKVRHTDAIAAGSHMVAIPV
ncbi:hypothetical protein PLICRDRAFT_108610 [Plicaturopsis crispa FD-325 SS-3]|nr:hypothetical protein PLICRDRAFT_108610 [Plicaturopsis crispa FD-325 SS-3]